MNAPAKNHGSSSHEQCAVFSQATPCELVIFDCVDTIRFSTDVSAFYARYPKTPNRDPKFRPHRSPRAPTNQRFKHRMPIDTLCQHQTHLITTDSSPDTQLRAAAAAAAASATAAAIAAAAAAAAPPPPPPPATVAARLLSLCTGSITHVPKDGACLFSAALLELKRLLCEPGPACDSTRHNSEWGMLAFHSAFALRQQTAAWIYHHADCSFGDIPLRDWIGHETGETVSQYCSRMKLPTEWGGVIELFAISRIFGVGVWVYEPTANSGVYAPGRPAAPYMRRTHALEPPAAAAAAAPGDRAASGAACLLYNGTSHYDVFSPAVGPALKVPRGLPASAENARRVHQMLRCSEDLDLSRCTTLAPEMLRCWEDISWDDLSCVTALAPPAARGADDAPRPSPPPPPPPPLIGCLGRVIREQPPTLEPLSFAFKAAPPSPPLRGGGGFAASSHGASTGDEQAGGRPSAVDVGTAAALMPAGTTPRLARRPVRTVWPWQRRRAGQLQLQDVRV